MKKVLLVGLMVLLSMGMLFAVTDTDGTIPPSTEAATDKVEFRLNLSGTGDGDTSSWVIGFSSTPYEKAATDLSPITTTQDLEIDDTTHTASYGKDGGLNAYWNITSGTPAVVSLYMEGALTGTSSTGGADAPTLGWSISVGENGKVGTKDSVYGPEDAIVLVTTEPSKGVVSIGSKPVVVTTADISKATPDTYTGSLVISIAAE